MSVLTTASVWVRMHESPCTRALVSAHGWHARVRMLEYACTGAHARVCTHGCVCLSMHARVRMLDYAGTGARTRECVHKSPFANLRAQEYVRENALVCVHEYASE